MKKLFTLLAAVSLLTSCATGYHTYGLTGGYKEKMLSSDTMLVTYVGNGFTGSEKTYEYAMKRAAEATLQHGYHYFEVLTHRNFVETKTTYTSATPYGMKAGFPHAEITIKFLNNKSAKSYNADKVFSQVSAD